MFSSDKFSPKRSGLFWFFFNIFTHDVTNVSVTLVSNKSSLYLRSFSTIIPDQIITVTDLLYLEMNEIVFIQSNNTLSVCHFHEASFIGFRVGSNISEFQFAALKVEMQYFNGTFFNVVERINVNWMHISAYNEINVPLKGVYIIALTAFVTGCAVDVNISSFTDITMHLNSITVTTQENENFMMPIVYTMTYIAQETYTLSGIIALDLHPNNKVMFNCFLPSINRITYQFVLYNPSQQLKVAWTVFVKGEPPSATIHVNEGDVWNEKNQLIRIRQQGTYFISLLALTISFNEFLPYVILNRNRIILKAYTYTARLGVEDLDFDRENKFYTKTACVSALVILRQEDELKTKNDRSPTNAIFTGLLLHVSG